MADGEAPGRGRQFLGQPWWIWAAGGAALLGGYIYLRRKATAAAASQAQQSSAAGATTAAGSTSPTGMSWEQFLLFIHDQQGAPAPAPAAAAAAKTPPPPKGTPQTTTKSGQKLYWSGDLNRWMTAQQWHQWHVAHEQHLARTGKAA